VTPDVETTDPDGVDFGWVMQVTFVVTIVVGAPLVAVLSLGTRLPDWGTRAAFAVRVGALVWFLTAVCVYGYARWQHSAAAETGAETEASADVDRNGDGDANVDSDE
jgi:hypothetical protein